jgi:hypothetical protein
LRRAPANGVQLAFDTAFDPLTAKRRQEVMIGLARRQTSINCQPFGGLEKRLKQRLIICGSCSVPVTLLIYTPD